jgi:hypothetical protein
MDAIRNIPDPSDQPMTPEQIPAWCTYEHSEERVLPYEFVRGARMLLIGASVGSGKTHQVHEYLRNHPELGRVLIVTADEQQAEATHIALADLQWDDGSCGFTCSASGFTCSASGPDEPVRHSDRRLGLVNKLVVNYTSLHEMIVGMTINSYDLVIVDDIRNVLSKAHACVQFSQELKVDHDILQSLTSSRHSICLGADIEMDGAVWGWVAEAMCDENIEYHRYTHVAERRELVVVHTSQWERMLCASLALGHRVGVLCRSKTTMHGVLALDEVVRHHTLGFDDDSDPDQTKQLQNINENLDGVDVLAFADQTATGIHVQETFHTVYAHCDVVDGSLPREMLHMIGRFRHVTSGQIVCCLPAMQDHTQSVTCLSESDVIRRFEDDGVQLQSYVGLGRTIDRDDGMITMTQHPLIALTAHARVERNGCFATSFVQQALRKGWRVTVGGVADDTLAGGMKQLLVDNP